MIKLYQKDVYLTSCDAEIISVSEVSHEIFDIELSQTIFFPTGGGQSCDRGTIDSKQVLDVRQEGDRIIHQIKSRQNPITGQKVHCILDWDHRFDNMQRHLGEHILSGAFHRLFGGQNKGFHMGEDSMTIDILLPNTAATATATFNSAPAKRKTNIQNTTYSTAGSSDDIFSQSNAGFDDNTRTCPNKSGSSILTMEMALQAEALANKEIWQNLPVSVSYFTERNQAESMPLRKELAFDEYISIVLVGNEEDPADCVACCGTHPSTSAQVGLIKVYKVEKNKNMYRVYFEAGKRAMENYDKEHEVLTTLGNHYSSGILELPEKLQARECKESALHHRLEILNKMLIANKIDEIRQSEEIIFEIDPLTIDDGLRIGKKVTKPFYALHIKEAHTLLLFSSEAKDQSNNKNTVKSNSPTDSKSKKARSREDKSCPSSIDCNALVKASGLKGGGRKGSARAMGSEQELEAFIQQLKQKASTVL